MSDAIDTSAARVTDLCQRLEDIVQRLAHDVPLMSIPARPERDGDFVCREAQRMLRALLAERDKARSDLLLCVRQVSEEGRLRGIAEAERDAAQAEVKRLREAGLDALASLVAAHSLLQTAHSCGKQPRMVVAGTKMLEQMLKDYEASIQRARAALAKEAFDG